MIIVFIIDEDQHIIAAIYEKNYKSMMYAATQVLGESQCEDVLHDAFLYLLEEYHGRIFELRNKPTVYFVLIVKSHSINRAKKNNTVEMELSEELHFTLATPEQETIMKDSEAQLVRLIQSLSPIMSEILEYKYILDYSNKEIAELLGLPVTTVSSRIDRAKKALREKLEERMVQEAYD